MSASGRPILTGDRQLVADLSRCHHSRELMSPIDPQLPFATDRSQAFQSGLLLRYRLARVLELLPVRRVPERFVVLRERLLRASLLREHVAPYFQRIGPVWPLLIGVLELGHRTVEIPVLGERHAPGVVGGG